MLPKNLYALEIPLNQEINGQIFHNYSVNNSIGENFNYNPNLCYKKTHDLLNNKNCFQNNNFGSDILKGDHSSQALINQEKKLIFENFNPFKLNNYPVYPSEIKSILNNNYSLYLNSNSYQSNIINNPCLLLNIKNILAPCETTPLVNQTRLPSNFNNFSKNLLIEPINKIFNQNNQNQNDFCNNFIPCPNQNLNNINPNQLLLEELKNKIFHLTLLRGNCIDKDLINLNYNSNYNQINNLIQTPTSNDVFQILNPNMEDLNLINQLKKGQSPNILQNSLIDYIKFNKTCINVNNHIHNNVNNFYYNHISNKISETEKSDEKIFINKKNRCSQDLNSDCIIKPSLDEGDSKVFRCLATNCKKAYKSRENLNLHIKNKHFGVKPYICKFCTAKFSHRNGKTYHERKVHLKYLPFICSKEKCTLSFASKSALKYHSTHQH